MKISTTKLKLGLVATVVLLAGCSASSSNAPTGDPMRGEKVHAACLDCHGTGVYTSAERKIKSLSALRKEVARWGDYYSPALSEQDNADVVVYLNTNFYKF
jgi:cytochrome c2